MFKATRLSLIPLYLLGAVAVFASLGIAPEEQPEKLVLGGGGYNALTQEFEVRLSARPGIATAGAKGRFAVTTTVAVTEPGTGVIVGTAGPSDNPVERDTSIGGGHRGGEVPLQAALVPWDRNGGAFRGLADITVKVELKNSSGKVIGEASSTYRDVLIEPPPAAS